MSYLERENIKRPISFVIMNNILMMTQGYVDFGRFDNLNDFVATSEKVNFVQVSCIFFCSSKG